MRNHYQLRISSAPCAPFQISYENLALLPSLLEEKHLLAIICFGPQATAVVDPRIINVELPEVGGGPTLEVWRAPCPVEIGSEGEIRYSRTETVLLGCLQFAEDEFASMEAATYHVYRAILACQQQLGYPYLLRTWNYLPDIHREERRLERYRAFCLGRHRALTATPNFEKHLVAATAMGTATSRTLIYFLAAGEPGVRVENPRQVSAFRYPSQYAPRSPSFSRATLKPWGAEAHLYVSGTASIVGHETQHAGNPLAQLSETLSNLQALVDNARRLHRLRIHDLTELSLLKVYLRQGVDMPAIAQFLHERLDDKVPTLFLQGDICRNDLLVEIEAFHAGLIAAADETRLGLNL
jgi:chorismate lyase / 3-hydroxybenzoate synthase